MCFIISNDTPKKLIADTHIICYKVLYPVYRGYKSAVMGYMYHTHKKNPSKKIVKIKNGDLQTIESGYHSYTTVLKAVKESIEDARQVVITCVIPKGSTYYINEDREEYVSSNILLRYPTEHDYAALLYGQSFKYKGETYTSLCTRISKRTDIIGIYCMKNKKPIWMHEKLSEIIIEKPVVYNL